MGSAKEIQPCEKHQKLNDDHTVRELRECHPMMDLNLPFEEGPITRQDLETHVAGGVVVLSAVIDTALGRMPVLVFRFVKSDGLTFFPDMTLVGDPVSIANTATLVSQSAHAAIKAAAK